MSLLGAATLAAGVILVRQRQEAEKKVRRRIPAGEGAVRNISLERLRELGF